MKVHYILILLCAMIVVYAGVTILFLWVTGLAISPPNLINGIMICCPLGMAISLAIRLHNAQKKLSGR